MSVQVGHAARREIHPVAAKQPLLVSRFLQLRAEQRFFGWGGNELERQRVQRAADRTFLAPVLRVIAADVVNDTQCRVESERLALPQAVLEHLQDH